MPVSSKDKILSFLQSQKLAVIATAREPGLPPESALIAFAEDDQLHLYFQTGAHTRKASNLGRNAHVSLVIGLQLDDLITVQYEGTAQKLTNSQAIATCKQRFALKNSPTTQEYLNHPSAILFEITPTWIGCSDYSGEEPEVIELTTF